MLLQILIILKLISFISSDHCDQYPDLGFYMISTKENVTEYSSLKNLENIKIFLINYATCEAGKIGFLMISYGFTESFDSSSVQDTIAAFKDRGDFIIFLLDWSEYNNGNYLLDASENAHRIGPIFGNVLWDLHLHGSIDLNDFEFIGNSLGAHMVAFVARQIFKSSGNTFLIPKITGLDPAGIAYFDSLALKILQSPLNANDGKSSHTMFPQN